MMKEKRRLAMIAVSAVFFLLALFAGFFGSVTEDLTDNINYRQNNNGGKITNDTAIIQSFLCNQDRIKALTLRTSTFGNTFSKGSAVFTLSDEKGQELAREEIPLNQLKDKGAATFSFETLSGVKGQVLTFKASASGMEEGQAYSLMIGQGSVGGSLSTADGKTSEKNSLFMTMTYEHTVYAVTTVVVLLAFMVICLSLLPMCQKEEER